MQPTRLEGGSPAMQGQQLYTHELGRSLKSQNLWAKHPVTHTSEDSRSLCPGRLKSHGTDCVAPVRHHNGADTETRDIMTKRV